MQSHEIKEFSQTEAVLNELERAYKLCHQGTHLLGAAKVTLEKLRRQHNDDDQRRIKNRNDVAKRVTDRIKSLKYPLKPAQQEDVNRRALAQHLRVNAADQRRIKNRDDEAKRITARITALEEMINAKS